MLANAAAGPGENHSATPKWNELESRLAPEQEGAASQAPRVLEAFGGKWVKIMRLFAAGIEDDEIGRIPLILGKVALVHRACATSSILAPRAVTMTWWSSRAKRLAGEAPRPRSGLTPSSSASL
jgi:hypothetical protein